MGFRKPRDLGFRKGLRDGLQMHPGRAQVFKKIGKPGGDRCGFRVREDYCAAVPHGNAERREKPREACAEREVARYRAVAFAQKEVHALCGPGFVREMTADGKGELLVGVFDAEAVPAARRKKLCGIRGRKVKRFRARNAELHEERVALGGRERRPSSREPAIARVVPRSSVKEFRREFGEL